MTEPSVPATTVSAIRAIYFFHLVGKVVERRQAIGLRPKSHLTKISKGLIFDLKKRIAIEKYIESFAVKLDPERVPPVCGNRHLCSVPALSSNDIRELR